MKKETSFVTEATVIVGGSVGAFLFMRSLVHLVFPPFMYDWISLSQLVAGFSLFVFSWFFLK